METTTTDTLYLGDRCPNCDAVNSLKTFIDMWTIQRGWICSSCKAIFIDSESTNKYREEIADGIHYDGNPPSKNQGGFRI